MKNKEIAQKFYELAELSELAEENPFKARAYLEVAQQIENLPAPVEALAREGKLTSVKGVGKASANKILQYLNTGHIDKLEELKKKIPESLLDLKKIPELGIRRTKILFDTLDIKSVESLEKAAMQGKIRNLPGFGEKIEKRILKGLKDIKNRQWERLSIGIALPLAESIVDELKKYSPVEKIKICGSIRRMKRTIGDIDILVVSNNPVAVMDKFVSFDMVKNVIVRGEKKSSILLTNNIQVDLRIVQRESFGAAIQYFTGSKEHNIKIRELANKRNLKINEYGVFDLSTNKCIARETEESIYKSIGLSWIPPEMREDRGEIELAIEGKLPKLIELTDIRGDIHLHSLYSDGVNSIEEMAQQAIQLGYSYIVITDHARALGVANGLSIERYKEEKKEIEQLNRKFAPFKIFLGTELNILSDGRIDFSDEELNLFDICLVGIHSGMNQEKEKMTNRIIKAMSYSGVRVIAHPMGGIIGWRNNYDVDLDSVFKEAQKRDVLVEINASPQRLDLDDINARRAREIYNLKFEIGTDAHSIDGMKDMRYGVGVARRAWLTKDDVI
ncbi:MAG: DNA polymerase/3'-5' exonuclease PolX, partial [Caldisericota bacterium]|nr:DNA polymerase/3'-5' exonuclease PolX [Caldisericota bacterium]